MKNHLIFLFVIFCISTNLRAQEYNVTGRVLDNDQNPIVFANVLLLKNIDSSIVKGTSTDNNGEFVIINIAKGEYLLQASYIENTSKLKRITVSSDVNTGKLIVAESQKLDEVVVTYEKPKLERKIDRLVFNVENTALADGNIWELLQQTPTVNVVQGVLTIKGAGHVGVMINGKKVNIPESDIINLLSGSSASNVEAIEVITNPPLKYSADSGMLINIKMKNNLVAGYNGAIFNNFTKGYFAKNTVGTDHFFKGKKTSFSVNYSFAYQKDIERYSEITSFSENAIPSAIWRAERNLITRRKRHNLNAFFNFEIDKSNVLSISTINVYNPDVNESSDSETVIANMIEELQSSFSSLNDSNQKQRNNSFYVDWVHQLKKKGSEISFGSHFTDYNSKIGQDLDNDFFDLNGMQIGNNDFKTKSNQRINVFSFQTDYSSPLGKFFNIKSGLRYASINSESLISQVGFDRSQSGINPTEMGLFIYDEAIAAAYTSFDREWNFWNLTVGLRAEYTETKGKLDTEIMSKKTSYLEFFPQFGLQYTPSKKHQWQLTYYRRIKRPRYDKINPFQQFLNNNSIKEGNSNLLPGIRNWLAAEYTFNRNYTLAFFFLKWKNPFREQTFQDNENNLLRYISTNLEGNQGYGIDLTISQKITSYWQMHMFLTAYYNEERFRDFDTDQLINNTIYTGFVRLKNSLSLLQNNSLVAELNISIYGPRVLGNAKTDPYNNIGLRLKKSFWNKNASLSIGLQDIFNQGNQYTSRNYLDQNNSTLFRPENRLFTLGFRYKFGNTRIKTNQKRKHNDERGRI